MGRIFRYTILAAMGAMIAWAFMERTYLGPDHGESISYAGICLTGLIFGAMIGLALGIAEGKTLSPHDAAKCAITGLCIGAVGGIIGLAFGNAFYNMMEYLAGGDPFKQIPAQLPSDVAPQTPKFLSFCLLLIGRGFGWSLIGMFIGISQGIATGSTKKMTSGAIGGFIGGGIGGIVFEILKWMNLGHVANFPPAMLRFISYSVTGAAIGLLIGSAEEFAKQAWLVRLVGRNEGRSYDLYKASTVMGRSEMADIPIFTDPDVAERHSVITTEGKSYAIQDLGSALGTDVNGVNVSKDYLRDGDVITVGKTKFVFRDKVTASSHSSSAYYNNAVQIPTSQHVCQFCGSIKDAAGNCDCSVGGSPPPISQQTMQQPAMVSPTMGPFVDNVPSSNAGATSPGPKLVGVVGPYAGQVFMIKSGETQIGREASKDIGLPDDTTTSRNHARIAQEVTCYVIYDLGSTNGTYVDGARIQRKELAHGDIVQIGNTKFRFER
ncbi:MAG: FHA domain-containing protein [Armatimonadetes bacterium]|nr:FHA domain-containing protein [Armatimonadota bacterium]